MLFIWHLQEQHTPLCQAPVQALQGAADVGPPSGAFLGAQNPPSLLLSFLGSREARLGGQYHHYPVPPLPRDSCGQLPATLPGGGPPISDLLPPFDE